MNLSSDSHPTNTTAPNQDETQGSLETINKEIDTERQTLFRKRGQQEANVADNSTAHTKAKTWSITRVLVPRVSVWWRFPWSISCMHHQPDTPHTSGITQSSTAKTISAAKGVCPSFSKRHTCQHYADAQALPGAHITSHPILSSLNHTQKEGNKLFIKVDMTAPSNETAGSSSQIPTP